MAPSYAYNSVDILLKDLMGNDLPFGGKTVLIAGDFRQTLPIYKHGTPADVLGITIKKSKIWNGIKKYALTVNMRADSNEIQYKNYQLQVGDGEIPCKYEEELIPLPHEIVLENDTTKLLNSEDCENYLIDHIFGRNSTDVLNNALNSNTAILCPKNEDVLSVNENVLKRLDTEGRLYFSSDHIECEYKILTFYQCRNNFM